MANELVYNLMILFMVMMLGFAARVGVSYLNSKMKSRSSMKSRGSRKPRGSKK